MQVLSSAEELEALAAVIQSNSTLNTALSKPWIFQEAKERLSQIFGMCDADQRILFLSFLSRYQILDQYEPYAYVIVGRIVKLLAAGSRVEILTPSIKLPTRPKSGDHLLYEIKSQLNGRGISDKQFATRNLVPEKHSSSAFYVIVDDFSGTGKTITDAIDKLLLSGVKSHRIRVELIYAMDDAIKAIIGRGVLANRQLGSSKSISAFNYDLHGMNLDAGVVYDSLESVLDISDDYRRGFGKSESLISMKRTPNNTLPIFWSSKARTGLWPAPFPR